ncbi:MAG: glycosyltransferase family 2 protein, partial [Candidatus Edwardsbacteria bacterium]|nr:glycosyltransferase family 2 protein [Candidatus Edwardsbacteria bacterium]
PCRTDGCLIMRTLVIIPAYNAGKHLPQLLPEILRNADRKDITVIDDGSSDNTAVIAERAGVIVLRNKRNLGKGAALKRGFAHAILNCYDAVITLDADGQHPPELIPRLIDKARHGSYDIIIASRRRQFDKMRWERALSNRMTTTVVSLLAGARIEDSQCGYRFLLTGVLRCLSLSSGGFQTESELLIQAGRIGARIGHIDCEVRSGPTSHISHGADTARFIAMCLRYL